jgi:hypothetical protein
MVRSDHCSELALVRTVRDGWQVVFFLEYPIDSWRFRSCAIVTSLKDSSEARVGFCSRHRTKSKTCRRDDLAEVRLQEAESIDNALSLQAQCSDGRYYQGSETPLLRPEVGREAPGEASVGEEACPKEGTQRRGSGCAKEDRYWEVAAQTGGLPTGT